MRTQCLWIQALTNGALVLVHSNNMFHTDYPRLNALLTWVWLAWTNPGSGPRPWRYMCHSNAFNEIGKQRDSTVNGYTEWLMQEQTETVDWGQRRGCWQFVLTCSGCHIGQGQQDWAFKSILKIIYCSLIIQNKPMIDIFSTLYGNNSLL